MAHSEDLRIRVVTAYNNKEGSIRDLAARFVVDKRTVCDWLKLHRETGLVTPRPHAGGAHLKLTPQVLDAIRALLQQQNDLTDDEIRALLLEQHDIEISARTVNRGIHKLGWSRKKKRFTTPKKTKNESKPNAKNS